ncbi:MAG: DNA alkylation repair protein [Deltaproteobacteria bacterium]|nr:DNA alkylation repair protein [Deltaproteobacteria bacterium]
MAEPFKEAISRAFVRELARAVAKAEPGFDPDGFVAGVCLSGFEELGLMDRVSRVAAALGEHLPGGFRKALKSLLKVHKGFGGLGGFVFSRFVALHGLAPGHFDASMDALARFTCGSSSEFGVRPFIRLDPERALGHIRKWALSPDPEVRRLASEGSRPRLPWGGNIAAFTSDPAPVLALVESLLGDPSQYVRTSLGNSLNDVSKDHPDLFLEFAGRFMGKAAETDRILRRGARTLIKRKNPGAMALFGYAAAPAKRASMLKRATLSISPKTLKIGGSAELSYGIALAGGFGGKVRLEYLIGYPVEPGRSPRSKLFFLKESDMEKGGSAEGVRRVAFKDLSVRRQVPGLHSIELMANGVSAARTEITVRR